ncbi:MAG: protein-L-isoaspartate(D-aspartate) O-methyltransferase, partial [Candidatus Omnitrophica bacterium]|nr:protein-L-isoaspartate(D-aspartate) O-methyltransferase [Candidatus Omnitrophota bacterium]
MHVRTTVLVIISILFSGGLSSYALDQKVAREEMVERQIRARGVDDSDVLRAMTEVRRHFFVPDQYSERAYDDTPLPIGFGQTISQPYVVAYMTAAAGVRPTDRVLEIGTGSGYQAAVLAELAEEVYTIERIEALAENAEKRLRMLGYDNIHVRWGDGYKGWPEKAPFDVIIVTAAPPDVPEKLKEQLAEGGRMVVPVGSFFQELYLLRKTGKGIEKKKLFPVRFVP